MRRWLEQLQIRFEETVARVERALRRFSLGALLLDAWAAFERDGMNLFAAALAYYSLLSLFPLLLLLISLVTFFISADGALEIVIQSARTYVPGAERELQGILSAVIEQRGPATFIGFVTLFWAASGVFDVLQHALDRAWRVPHARALWLQRLLSLGFVGLLGFLFLVSASTALASQEFVLEVFGVSRLAHDLVRWFSALTGFGAALIAFTMLYKVIPLVRVSWSVALRGAVVAALLWQAAKAVYEVYLNFFAQFSLVYGSVGAVIGLLLWGYISAMVLLYGGELAAALHEREKLS